MGVGKPNRRQKPPKPPPCRFCGKQLRSQKTSKKHLLSHTLAETDRLPCLTTGCQKTFTTIRRRKQHQEEVHEHRSRVDCSVCGSTLANPSSLKQHMLRYHTVIPASDYLPCQEPGCPKSYKTQGDRDHHQRIAHEGKYRVNCPECGNSFAHSPSLRKHIETVQQRTEPTHAGYVKRHSWTCKSLKCM
jgi:ribosomal protein S27E